MPSATSLRAAVLAPSRWLLAPVRWCAAKALSIVGVKGLYGHVERNDMRSLVMFAGFVLAFQLVAAVALFLPLLFLDLQHTPIYDLEGYLRRYEPFVLAFGVGLFLVQFLRHTAGVRRAVSFQPVARRDEPRLVNIVEQQAIAAGLPLPAIGIIETPARNAFACGLDRHSAWVVVTRGLVDSLDDEELEAVAAHEVTHIRNGDIRLMAVANVLLDNLLFLQRHNMLRIEGWRQIALIVFMPPFLLMFLFAGFVTSLAMTLARVSRLLVSSSREFIADAEAVRMTHNPAALISALRRIEGHSAVEDVDPAVDAMMIDGAVAGPFATHPTVAERIDILVRLAGDMALVGGPRRDTRPAGQAMSSRGSFGRRSAAGEQVAAVRSLLVDRVNQGTGVNAFGLTPRLGRLLLIAMAVLVAVQLVGFRSAERALFGLRPDAVRTALAPVVSGPSVGSMNGLSPHRAPVGAVSSAAASATPGETMARCFETEPYRVGDRGLRELESPDYQRVQAYSLGKVKGGSSTIEIEKYLGMRAKSVRGVRNARGEALDAALAEYVKTRKTTLTVAHRFFGAEGLNVMQQAYDDGLDREILATLARRLGEGAPALLGDPESAAELALLVSAPEAFVPCLARAGENGAGGTRADGIRAGAAALRRGDG